MHTTTLGARRWALAGLVIVAGLGGSSARGATLRWKFQPGETLHYVMDQTTMVGIKAKGQDGKQAPVQDVKTTTTQKIDMDWTVKEVGADGMATLTQTITRVRTKMESPVQSFEFDSKSPKEPEGAVAAAMVPVLKALVGAQFAFKMSPQGELSDVKIPESLVKALKSAGPAGGASPFSEEGLKNMVTESSLALPKDELAPGKSWARQTKLPIPPIGSMTIDKTYTFQGPDAAAGQGIMRIDLDTKVGVQPAAGNNIEVTIKSQEGKGSFFFDNTAGRVADSRVSEKVEMLFKLQGAEITQENETTTSMRLGQRDEAPAAKTAK